MSGATYGQFCGLARALELVGERWSLLIVRDLLLSPKSVEDLRRTLPRIPSSTLSNRLAEMERCGVVRRVGAGTFDGAAAYELTEYGSDLDEIVLRLGLWGARSLGTPAEDDMFSLDSAILSLYTMFRPEAAVGLHATYELRLGDMVVHAVVDDGGLKATEGGFPNADLVIEVRGNIKPLYAKEITPREAVDSGLVSLDGDPTLFDRFAELFVIPPAPALV